MELMIFIAGTLSGFTLGKIWVSITNRLGKKSIIRNYHFHHSLFAIPLFIIALFTHETISSVFLGLGTGIIIQHTFKEGFKFITK